MNSVRHWGAMIVGFLGLASLVLGVVFIFQANSAQKIIADEIQPLKIAEVDARYEAVKASQTALMAAEEPSIQAGTAAPSATYSYLTAQRASLGLAKANIGLAGFVRTSGIVGIVIGVGLILTGVGLFKKGQA